MKKIFTLIAAAIMAVGANAQTTTVYWDDDNCSANNEVTFQDGIRIKITGNESKDISGGSKVDFNGESLKTIKVSNGAQNTMYLPTGKVATKLVFYSYVNYDKASKGNDGRVSYWKEVDGTEYDETTATIMTNYIANKVVEGLDAITFDINKKNEITFTNTGEQACYIVVVTMEDADLTSINCVTNETIDLNAPAYNIAGQRVNADAKGLVIKNGKKYMNK